MRAFQKVGRTNATRVRIVFRLAPSVGAAGRARVVIIQRSFALRVSAISSRKDQWKLSLWRTCHFDNTRNQALRALWYCEKHRRIPAPASWPFRACLRLLTVSRTTGSRPPKGQA
ncbi:MAG: hypothetical protein DWI21_08060 [Planctomycetota bacterium]|nr:MAG: hypothetical protein DWI21_08060 [Planctomycetota bacterium]